jgi:hypothetical protein
MKEISWDEFEQLLIKAGWGSHEAKQEREEQEHGSLGDCDGDLDLG